MKLFKKTLAILALAALSMSMVACGSPIESRRKANKRFQI